MCTLRTVKFFVLTPNGEQGPFTAAQLNRMFAECTVQADQLVREEGATEAQPLKERFRHLAPANVETVSAVRVSMQAHARQEGIRGEIVGGVFAIIGGTLGLFQGLVIGGLVAIATGIVFVARGSLRKGGVAIDPSDPTPAPAAEESTERPAKTFDY